MKCIKLFLLLLIVCSSRFGSAQTQMIWKKGYVLLTTGDTVKGEIRLNTKKEFDLYSKVTVKKSEDEKKTFSPQKAREYCFEDTHFVSRLVEGEGSFVKCVSLGAVNLYEHQYEWQSGNEIIYKSEYFIEKAHSTEIVRVRPGKFKKIVEEYMGDNAELVQQVKDKKYDFEQLTEVVQTYNSWAKAQKG
jgi:hypothetical protein